MFDHQISRFEKRIADLPDQPTLAPDALKAWFDSAPEQLRQALNRVCADGKTLEERMESLVIGAYGGTVTREMLAQELQQEIAGKAEQSAVQASLSALSGSFTDSMQSTVEAMNAADAETNARVDQLCVRHLRGRRRDQPVHLARLYAARRAHLPHGRRVFAGESDLRRPCDGGVARKDCRDRGERLQRAELVLALQRQ